MNRTEIPFPLVMRTGEAAKALGICKTVLLRLSKEGVIPCVCIGNGKRKTFIYPVAEMQAWLARETSKARRGREFYLRRKT